MKQNKKRFKSGWSVGCLGHFFGLEDHFAAKLNQLNQLGPVKQFELV